MKQLFLIAAIAVSSYQGFSQGSLVSFPDSTYFTTTYLSPKKKSIATPSFYGILNIGQPYDSLDWEPFYKTQPSYSISDIILSNAGGKRLAILFDTTQKVECIAYKASKKNRSQLFYSRDKKGTFKNSDPYTVPITGMPVYVLNLSDSNVTIRHPKYRLNIVQEALNDKSEWIEIEILPKPKKGSFISQSVHTIKNGQFILTVVPVYHGTFNTKLRLKMQLGNNIYYSQAYDGSINWEQLEK